MKSRFALFLLFVLIATLLLSACGAAAAATQAPSGPAYIEEPMEAATELPAATEAPMEMPASDSGLSEQAAPEEKVVGGGQPLTNAAAYEIANPEGDLTVIERSNRMIVKNADIKLTVKDTDVAIDRATQIIGDAGGYIVSSRVWYQDYYGNNLKYASITIGVPVTEFEKVLVRLRGLAVKVVDEKAAGDDVTDQYVDLQSQLTNLEATRARIQEFLTDAKTVDEALRINQELANLEAQIEQIKGRMNYLNDRSAFSTITINFEPEFPILTATPTLTTSPTVTPSPTATPIPWNPGQTFHESSKTVTVVYQGIANLLIQLFVIVLPILLPPALIVWGLWKLMNRKPGKVGSEK
ncbi:MAG TPA: DUF4349 domain-containing protein [Anaerolineales bacterium]|nr:DUF4349 domain-containing protein [Anaerolineales bacterium]